MRLLFLIELFEGGNELVFGIVVKSEIGTDTGGPVVGGTEKFVLLKQEVERFFSVFVLIETLEGWCITQRF